MGARGRVRLLCALAVASSIGLLGGCRKGPGRQPADHGSNVPLQEAAYVSGKKTRVYHARDCRYARDIEERDLLGYHNQNDAERAGRIPCAACRPQDSDSSTAPATSARPRDAAAKPAP